jgi:hypothetical protein
MSLMFIFGGGLALSALWYAGERYLVKSEPTTKRAKVEVKPAITPNIDGAPALSIPKLGTQIAKEDFQKAINDMSKIVGRASDLVKTSSTLAGSRPLIQKDTDNGANLVATLQQMVTQPASVH